MSSLPQWWCMTLQGFPFVNNGIRSTFSGTIRLLIHPRASPCLSDGCLRGGRDASTSSLESSKDWSIRPLCRVVLLAKARFEDYVQHWSCQEYRDD